MRKRILFNLLAIIALDVDAFSQPLDQFQTNYRGALSARTLPGYAEAQTITAGYTGTMTQIDLRFFNNIRGNGTLNIYSGSGISGALLQSKSVSVVSSESAPINWNNWDVNVPVIAGSKYTFEFIPDAGSMPDPYGLCVGNWYDYLNGSKLICYYKSSSVDTNFSLVFRTYVDTNQYGTLTPTPQFITNNLTFSLSRGYEAKSFKVGSTSITPAPIWKVFSNSDLLTQLKKSYPSIVTPRASLQVLVDTNDNIFTQVKNANSTTVVNISDVLKIKIGTNGVSSGSLNTTSAISTINNLSTMEIAYDDTAINSSNGMNFKIHAICSSSVLTTPTKTNGVFLVRSSFSTTGGVGDGYSWSTNGSSYFIIRNTAVNAVGSGYLDFQK